MPSFEHPMLILLALAACIAAFPLRRFFSGEADGSCSFGIRWYGFLGVLAITSLAVYSLASRIFGTG